MSKADAKAYFLSAVCPLDTALHSVETVSLKAGGWDRVEAADVRPVAKAAADQARRSAVVLQSEAVVWPGDLTADVAQVGSDMLALVSPLQTISAARSADAMQAAWQVVTGQTNTAEQQVRLDLGLPPAKAAKDGCPPAPKVTASPSSESSSGSGSGGAGGSSSGIAHWQSPSGNLRCAYFPQGSVGPSTACLDSDTNTLVRLSAGLARVSQATASQRSQLPGGSVQDFDDPARYYGTLPDGRARFTCWLSSDGMTCQDNEAYAWFVIRRGFVDWGD